VLDGRLTAEVAPIAKAGLPFEVAPGVSPVTAGPAYAGFTLSASDTHGVSVVDAEHAKIDWSIYADPASSLIIINASSKLPAIVRALLEAGRAQDTPLVVLRNATTIQHESTVTTLGEATSNARASVSLGEGSIVIISRTIDQREILGWFEHRPLLGWKVLVPRTRDEVGPVAEILRRLGAVTIEVPTISVEPPRTPQQMERAVQGMVSGRFEWVAFTSPHAVRAVREKLLEYGLDARSLAGMKVAAIGQESVDALLEMGIRPDLVPAEDASTAALLEEWPEFSRHDDPINRVFIPRADIATEALAEGLTALGWEVEEVTAYRTVRAAPPAAHIRDAIKSGGYDAALFTSASTVRNLVGIAGKPHASTVIACIGPQTEATAKEHGLRVDVLAPNPDVRSLIAALAEFAHAAREEAGDPQWRPTRRKAGARRKVN
jgi:uroporphyrinogen III methyltransferase/synthase